MLRRLMPIAATLRRRLLALLGRDTRGVKVLAFDRAARVLLVRHTYGRGDLYMLPGGGIARSERPEQAARRELREETGCHAIELALIGRYESQPDGRRDTIFLYRALTDDTPVPDGRELAEATFVWTDELPPATSPATRRRVEEWLGVRSRGTCW